EDIHSSQFASVAIERLIRAWPEPLGDWPAPAYRALRPLAELMQDPKTKEIPQSEDFDADLLVEVGGILRSEAQRIIAWAEWLGVAGATLPGRYRFNSPIARL